jgi:hypothetical protein
MTLSEIRERAIAPALALLPARMRSDEAEVMLLAIGLQESGLIHRHQIGGPAHGLLQFERGGGVRGVMNHPASKDHAARVCAERGVEPTVVAAFDAIEFDDVLAMAFARLLLWTDPKALPALGDEQGAWDLYLRVWRPGKPHRHTWAALYEQAMEEMTCSA